MTIHDSGIPQARTRFPRRSHYWGKKGRMKSECIFVRGLLVRRPCRRRGEQKNTTIWEGTMSAGAEVVNVL